MAPHPKDTKKPTKTSASRDLIATGPKVVSKQHGKRDGTTQERPTTTRALILRHSKYGAYGEGEMMLTSKMTGREKLDLLAGGLFCLYTQILFRSHILFTFTRGSNRENLQSHHGPVSTRAMYDISRVHMQS